MPETLAKCRFDNGTMKSPPSLVRAIILADNVEELLNYSEKIQSLYCSKKFYKIGNVVDGSGHGYKFMQLIGDD